jgi:hypothetical protein
MKTSRSASLPALEPVMQKNFNLQNDWPGGGAPTIPALCPRSSGIIYLAAPNRATLFRAATATCDYRSAP